MALTKQSESSLVYLEVKHYSLWRGLKKKVDGCDEVDANNPSTGQTVRKYGYKYRSVSGRAVKLVKYDTEQKYSKRYFGFKLHLMDEGGTFVIDMPYQSQILRRFLRLARNIDWTKPFSITIFKGKKKEGAGVEETGIWFEQSGETVKSYYTLEHPHGMPAATQDPDTHEWDFKAQHRWLVERLKSETIHDIETAAARMAPPIESAANTDDFNDAIEPTEGPDTSNMPPCPDGITDDDLPF